MKKFLFVLICVLTLTTLFAVSVSANENISVWMNGDFLDFDVPPQVINGRTMVPVRTIFENLGAKVSWNNDTQTITSTKGAKTVVMQINNYTMKINGYEVLMDTPPQIVDGRTLVPARAVAESFGNKVTWSSENSTVIISEVLNFNSVTDARNYLCQWILQNGKSFANSVSVGINVGNYEITADYVPAEDMLYLTLEEWIDDNLLMTSLFFGKDPTAVNYCTYFSSTNESKLSGFIDVRNHSENYPLNYIKEERYKKIGEFRTELELVEFTRHRINIALRQLDVLLGYYNAGVSLNSLGFVNY